MIVAVEPVASVPVRCIVVDSPSHLFLAGRGMVPTHNSRAGAEWVIKTARNNPGCRIAMVARTAADVRDVMIEGDSGIMNISPADFTPRYRPSIRRLEWPNGSQATLFSAEEPDALRGPQHHFGWLDEIAAWSRPEAFEMFLFGLRLGTHPRVVITTTPRPTKIIKDLIADPTCVTVRGSTYENRANLAPAYFSQIIRKYEGTRLGRQEINGEILDDNPGALFTRDMIERTRVTAHPPLWRVVVGVDPEASSGEESAETGIVVAGVDANGEGYILDDRTIRGSPIEWGRQAVAAYHAHEADRVVAEQNQGGEMVQYVISSVDPTVAYKGVHASRSKQARAEPVSALWEQGRIHMVGCFPELEDQLVEWCPGQGMPSPDRYDSCIWALHELMLTTEYEATVYDEVPAPVTSW
jgi:phage terminase large subunit-like protein